MILLLGEYLWAWQQVCRWWKQHWEYGGAACAAHTGNASAPILRALLSPPLGWAGAENWKCSEDNKRVKTEARTQACLWVKTVLCPVVWTTVFPSGREGGDAFSLEVLPYCSVAGLVLWYLQPGYDGVQLSVRFGVFSACFGTEYTEVSIALRGQHAQDLSTRIGKTSLVCVVTTCLVTFFLLPCLC